MTAPKIYTRGGDVGETSMFSGERVNKSDPSIASVGDFDELSVALGFARLACPKRADILKSVQKNLYQLSALISYAGDKHDDRYRLDAGEIETLESTIDEIQNALPPLTEFIYPGRTEAGCRLHMARAVARRAERGLTHLPKQKSEAVIPYINRLSDFLFALAREADHEGGAGEEGYRGDGKR
ncbi:MAG: cob(I)yrinic acid a,c-diamide adenosyltransferase [Parvularculaceae bacterium]